VNPSPLLAPPPQNLFLFVRVSGSAIKFPIISIGLCAAHFSCRDLGFGFAPPVSSAAIGSPILLLVMHRSYFWSVPTEDFCFFIR
jgi:hypothetical protein